MIKETFPALDKKLKRMESIIKDFPEEGHSMFVIKKAFYTAHKLSELQEIQHDLAGFQAIYSRAYNNWGEEAHTQLYLEIQEMLQRQDKSAQVQLQLQKDLQKVLEFLEKKGVQEAQKVAKNDDSGKLMEWESELVREGIGENEVKTILEPVLENLKINNTWSMEQQNNVTGRVSPKFEVNPQITIYNCPPEFSQPQASVWSQNWMPQRPSESTIPSSHSNSSGNRSPRPGTTDDAKSIWILCVDEANGGNYHALYSSLPTVLQLTTTVQSILSQTYLELIRAWTANTTSRWLFDRVDSAGANISTMFTKQVLPNLPIRSPITWEDTNKAIDDLAGDSSYFWSENYPHEKAVILERMRKHRCRGIQARHFSTYHYMICFSRDVLGTLSELKSSWEIDHQKYSCTRILFLPDCIPRTDAWKKAEKPHISEIRELIKGFLKSEFGWKVPMEVDKNGKEKRMGIAGGKERTLMLVLPERYRGHIKGKEKELSDRTGVRVRLTLEGTEEKHQLVSLTGMRSKLAAAEALIKGLA
jgi:hypothetical protein